MWFKEMIKQISSNEEEYEIIQYGLHQFFWILINLATVIICGVFWHEVLFALLLFFIIFVLRPYAGGYHADTEFYCYLLSVGVMNLAMIVRCFIGFSEILSILLYVFAVFIIWRYAPVANFKNPLEDMEIQIYSQKIKMFLFEFCIISAIGKVLKFQVLVDAVFYALLIIAFFVLMEKWRYSKVFGNS